MSILMIEDQLVTDEGSEDLKNQFENYCSWCWGHGYGDCDMCKRIYHRYYIPIRKRELQEKLGLNKVKVYCVGIVVFGIVMITSL